MEDSILKSTKKILGIAEDYTAFDLDIITHINATFSIVSQIGVGPVTGFMIEDEQTKWSEMGLPQNQLSMVRTYVFLKVRTLFDPPTTSFLIEAVNKQLSEFESRLNYFREDPISFSQDEIIPEPPIVSDEMFQFEYEQLTPSTEWVVVHDLNGHPNVTIVDVNGMVIYGGITYDSPNQLTISFSEALSGKVYLS